MKALTVVPGHPGTIRLEDVAELEPEPGPGDVVVDGLAVGICGTDREIIDGAHGSAPRGRARLVIGHESLGRVATTAAPAGPAAGDLVVAMVREPDPEPCSNCAVGEWDVCSNGNYREHGIKQLDGFARESWVVPADRLVEVPPSLGCAGVLVEPASVVAKAWERIDRIDSWSHRVPERALVTGAGPIGLLAALLGVQRGLDVHVLDVVSQGPKPGLVADLGATYHRGDVADAAKGADIVVECTGVGRLVVDTIANTSPNGIVCLTGLSTGGRAITVDAGELGRQLVLENDVVFGSVSANRRHYEQAVGALASADIEWLDRLVTRRVPLARWPEAMTPRPDDVKVVVDLTA